jgi:hypothetical protein
MLCIINAIAIPKKMQQILVYGLIINNLNISTSCGANIATACLLVHMIQKFRAIPQKTPDVIKAIFAEMLLIETAAYISQGRTKNIYSRQGGYHPQ